MKNLLCFILKNNCKCKYFKLFRFHMKQIFHKYSGGERNSVSLKKNKKKLHAEKLKSIISFSNHASLLHIPMFLVFTYFCWYNWHRYCVKFGP